MNREGVLSIEEARHVLGLKGQKLSDEQIKSLIDFLTALSYQIIEVLYI